MLFHAMSCANIKVLEKNQQEIELSLFTNLISFRSQPVVQGHLPPTPQPSHLPQSQPPSHLSAAQPPTGHAQPPKVITDLCVATHQE